MLIEGPSRKTIMTIVHSIPVSQPGLYLCEFAGGQSRSKVRSVTSRQAEAARMEKRGAVIWIARAGGWVRKD